MSERRRPEPDWSDEELVAACRGGDQLAWEALVEKYKRMVYAVPTRYRLPPEEAADVFQGVWMDLHRDLPRLERAASLRGWLLTATARRSLLHKKRRARHTTLSAVGLPEAAEPEMTAIRHEAEQEQRLKEAMARLPERCRQLVTMLFYEQPPVSYQQAAERLGLAVGSIGFIRGRCLAKLQKLLEEAGF